MQECGQSAVQTDQALTFCQALLAFFPVAFAFQKREVRKGGECKVLSDGKTTARVEETITEKDGSEKREKVKEKKNGEKCGALWANPQCLFS